MTTSIVCAGPGCEVVIPGPRWNQRFHDPSCRLAAWLDIHPRTYSVGGCPNCGAPLRLMLEARLTPGAIPLGVITTKNDRERGIAWRRTVKPADAIRRAT